MTPARVSGMSDRTSTTLRAQTLSLIAVDRELAQLLEAAAAESCAPGPAAESCAPGPAERAYCAALWAALAAARGH